VHAFEGSPAKGGRWVSTFASDIAIGDLIRRTGAERHVIGRDYTPDYQPTFLLSYEDGSEPIGKAAVVAIWDPDGSVAERVTNLSVAAILGAGNSGSQGVAGGFVVPL
jgi:hypothetical protein